MTIRHPEYEYDREEDSFVDDYCIEGGMSVVPPTTGQASALLPGAGGEGFGEEAPQDVGAGAAFGLGDLVDLGDGFGVESDGVELSGHVGQRITPLDNVIQRDTIQGMTHREHMTAAKFTDAIEAAIRLLHDNDWQPTGYMVAIEGFGDGLNVLWSDNDGTKHRFTVTVKDCLR